VLSRIRQRRLVSWSPQWTSVPIQVDIESAQRCSTTSRLKSQLALAQLQQLAVTVSLEPWQFRARSSARVIN
jgi:hypothetical protein